MKFLARRTYKFSKQFFEIFDMLTIDAIEAFTLSPATRNEAVNEFFVNGTKCLDIIAENKNTLLIKLKENQPIIEKVLSGIGASYTVGQVIEYIDKSLEKVKTASDTVKKVNQVVNGTFLEILKQGIFGFMCALGLSKFVPDYFVPTIEPYRDPDLPKRVYGRYAPIPWVTRLNRMNELSEEKIKQQCERPTLWIKEVLPNLLTRYIKQANQNNNKTAQKIPQFVPRQPTTVNEMYEAALKRKNQSASTVQTT